MKIFLLALLGVFFATNAFATKSCLNKATNQLAINECAGADLKAAEKEMQEVYQAIEEKYKDAHEFLAKLSTAQLMWERYRDAQLEMKFPNRNTYGSIYPMCAGNYLTELTHERTATLKKWLSGIEQGDTCGGSAQLKERK